MVGIHALAFYLGGLIIPKGWPRLVPGIGLIIVVHQGLAEGSWSENECYESGKSPAHEVGEKCSSGQRRIQLPNKNFISGCPRSAKALKTAVII
jgi:hypothetical protein